MGTRPVPSGLLCGWPTGIDVLVEELLAGPISENDQRDLFAAQVQDIRHDRRHTTHSQVTFGDEMDDGTDVCFLKTFDHWSVHQALLAHEKVRDFAVRNLVDGSDFQCPEVAILDHSSDRPRASHKVWREFGRSEALPLRDVEPLWRQKDVRRDRDVRCVRVLAGENEIASRRHGEN